jgi:hypothetical protein
MKPNYEEAIKMLIIKVGSAGGSETHYNIDTYVPFMKNFIKKHNINPVKLFKYHTKEVSVIYNLDLVEQI